METDPACHLDIEDGFAILTLNRPARGNALSVNMVEEMLAALASACASNVHSLVLRGRGRHFCSGFDLSDLANETDASLLARMVRIEMLLDALWRLPLRTIAIGHGRVTGAGADLLVACDHRLLAPDAGMTFPGARFGLVLGTRRLATRLGADRALRTVSEGLTLSAEQARDSGLVTALLPDNHDAGHFAPWHALPLPVVDGSTFALLRGALDDGGADADLAALVRSAARPGFKARLEAYRATLQKIRS